MIQIRRMVPQDLRYLELQPNQVLHHDPELVGRIMVEHGIFWTGLEEGWPIAIGGAQDFPGDWPMAFLLLSERAKRYPKQLLAAARRFFLALDEDGTELTWTVANLELSDIEPWITRLGFAYSGRDIEMSRGWWQRWERHRGS